MKQVARQFKTVNEETGEWVVQERKFDVVKSVPRKSPPRKMERLSVTDGETADSADRNADDSDVTLISDGFDA